MHLHLDGSVEPETLLEIDPALTREEIAERTAYTDFAGFLKSFRVGESAAADSGGLRARGPAAV